MDMHFINPEDIPPEILRAIQHNNDMHEMSYVDQSHQIMALFNELNEEQLQTVRMLITIAARGPMSAYFSGMISQVLQTKFGACMCGEKHDPSDLLNEEHGAKGTPMPSEAITEDQAEYRATKMEEYGVEEVPVPGNPNRTYFRCKNCEYPIASLKDRMRRDPGVNGCPGCQNKAKWG